MSLICINTGSGASVFALDHAPTECFWPDNQSRSILNELDHVLAQGRRSTYSGVATAPSHDTSASADSSSEDFAAASIAADIAGFRSRIYLAHSADGLDWTRAGCIIDGSGYESDEIDGVHAEDMSVTEIGDGHYRMYYAACGRDGNWLIASAVTKGEPTK